MRRTLCISDGELCISDGELCISDGELRISEGPMASAGATAALSAPAAAPPSSTASSAAVAPAGQWRAVASHSQHASATNSARAEVGTIRRCGTRLRAPSIRAAAEGASALLSATAIGQRLATKCATNL